MKDDPVINRVRKARKAISERFGHDPKKLVNHYIELEKKRKKEQKYRFV